MTEVSYLLVDRAKCPCDDQGPLGEGTNLMRRDFHANADNTCKQRFPEVQMRHYSPLDGLRGRISVAVYGGRQRWTSPSKVFKIFENSCKKRKLKVLNFGQNLVW